MTDRPTREHRTASYDALRLLAIALVVLSVISGGVAVTTTLTDESVSSNVEVQIDQQFVTPPLNNSTRADVRTSSPGRRSLFRTANGTRLTVVEENVTDDSLTVTVPVENAGSTRGTARLSVGSSTTPFNISTSTISASFANNSSFARTANHTVVGERAALIELSPTNNTEPRAINVTLQYDTTPASPLTATFDLDPTAGRVAVQPGGGGGGGGGGSGGGGGGGGGADADALSPAQSTVVTDGLKIINPNGTDPDPVLVNKSEVEAVGSAVDLDGDGRFEQPFVNDTGALKTVEIENTSTGVQIRNETTLVPASSSNSPRTSDTIMSAGRFDGSETSILYASTNQEIVRVDASGTTTVVDTTQTKSKSVTGVGDVDGDGVDELAFTDGSQNLKYLEPNGSVEKFGTGAGSNNGVGVDGLLDVDDDGAAEQLFVSGSNNVRAIDANDQSPTTLNGSESAAKSPIATADVDRDDRREVLFIDSQEVNYIDDVGATNVIRPLLNASGQPVTGSTETGLASVVDVRGGSGGGGSTPAVSPVEAQTVVFNKKKSASLRSVAPNGKQRLGTIQTKSLGPQAQLFGDQRPEAPFVGNSGKLKIVNESKTVRTLLDKSGNGDVAIGQGVRLGVADVDGDGNAAVVFSDNDGRIRRYEPATGQLRTVFSDSGVGAHSVGGLADFDGDGSRDELAFTDENKNLRILDTDTGIDQKTGFTTKNKIKIGSPVVDTDGRVKVPAVNASEAVVLVDRNGNARTLTTDGQPTGSLATVDIDDDGDDEILFANGNNNNEIKIVELNGNTRALSSSPSRTDGNTGVA